MKNASDVVAGSDRLNTPVSITMRADEWALISATLELTRRTDDGMDEIVEGQTHSLGHLLHQLEHYIDKTASDALLKIQLDREIGPAPKGTMDDD